MHSIQISGFKRCVADTLSDDQDQLSNRSLQKISDVDSVERNRVSFNENNEEYLTQNLKSSLNPISKSPNPSNNLMDQEIFNSYDNECIKTIENPLKQREINFLDETVEVVIADLGNACFHHHHFTDEIQTRQ